MVSPQNEEDGYDVVSEVKQIASNERNNQDRINVYEDVRYINEEPKFQVGENPYDHIWLGYEDRKNFDAFTSSNLNVTATQNVYYDLYMCLNSFPLVLIFAFDPVTYDLFSEHSTYNWALRRPHPLGIARNSAKGTINILRIYVKVTFKFAWKTL